MQHSLPVCTGRVHASGPACTLVTLAMHMTCELPAGTAGVQVAERAAPPCPTAARPPQQRPRPARRFCGEELLACHCGTLLHPRL